MISYTNVSPEVMKQWKKEYRIQCQREMREYLKNFPDATSEEKRDLQSWVRSGHSPYDNGDYLATDSGRPMDFINARRFLEDKCKEYLNDPDRFRGSHDPMKFVPVDSDSSSDLPF